MPPLLGAHESVAGGLHNVFSRAEDDGCDAVQIFTRSARRWKNPPLERDEIRQFEEAWIESSSVRAVVSHASYLVNLVSGTAGVRERSRRALGEELDRCHALGIRDLVLHPGAPPANNPLEEALDGVAAALDALLDERPRHGVTVCLETMAGQGAGLASRFEHLADILERMDHESRVGVCLDTAHVHAAGYDVSSPAGWDRTLEAFDRVLGLSRLRVVHLNDTEKACGSEVDRHARIGEGGLGLDTFAHIVADGRLHDLPVLLETPHPSGTEKPYREEIATLRSFLPSP